MRPARRSALRRLSALAGLAALPAAPGARAQAAAAEPPSPPVIPSRPFGDSVGLQVKFSQGEPVGGLYLVRELGVRWVREEVLWHQFEPAPGRYAGFPGEFIQRLRFYRRQGIGVIFILAYHNPVAYPDTPDNPARSLDPDAYGRFAAEVARRLRDAGVRFVLEVWNEPHNNHLPQKLGGQWNAAPPSPWVAHYVRMVESVRRVARALDPSIPVLTNDDMWVIHHRFLEHGLPPDIDGFAIHPYQPTPERAAVSHDTDWTRPFQVVDRDGSFRSGVRRLQEAARARLGRVPAIWITELGWAAEGPGVERGIPAARIAAYLPRAYIGAFAAGVEVMCWFSSMDTVDGPMGLRDNRGDARPALQAFRTQQAQLAPLHLHAQVAGADTLTGGLHGYLFGQGPADAAAPDDVRTLVLWSADDRPRPVRLAWDSGVDLSGRPLPRPAAAAADTLVVDAAPVYLRGRWDTAALRDTLRRAA